MYEKEFLEFLAALLDESVGGEGQRALLVDVDLVLGPLFFVQFFVVDLKWADFFRSKSQPFI